MANKYLVISPNGYGNIGDDICAYGGKAAIEHVDPSAEVVITRPPMKTALIDAADYVVLSGGGIIYDRAEKNVANYMNYLDEANKRGKKSAVLGVGVQGIVTDEGRERYRKSLALSEFISVRTQEDVDMLAEIGLKDVQATFDIAFLVPPLLESMPVSWLRRRKEQKLLASSGKPRIGICMINLRMLKRANYPGSEFEDFDNTMDEFIARAKDSFDIYLIQHAGEDGKLMRALAKQHGVTFVPYAKIEDAPTTYRLIKSLDLMIGVRLHSISLALMAGVPTIAVGSNGAKQKRLIDYALPSMKDQFFSFKDVPKLRKTLQKIAKTGEIQQTPLPKSERDKISKLNNANLALLKKLIKD